MLILKSQPVALLRRIPFTLFSVSGAPINNAVIVPSDIQISINGNSFISSQGPAPIFIGNGEYFYELAISEISSIGYFKIILGSAAFFAVPDRQTHQVIGRDLNISFLPGQTFYDLVLDDRGNGVPYVTVNVYLASTATLLATAQTDSGGRYSLTLTETLNVLVDLEFIGGGLRTFRKNNVKLS